MKDPHVVNGKRYGLWPKFAINKKKFIGGTLEDTSEGETYRTTITDVTFEPNGKESAMLTFQGEDFSCACDAKYLMLQPKSCGDGWFAFCSAFGLTFRVRGLEPITLTDS